MILCRLHRRLLLAALTIVTVVAGCDSDQRAVAISRESLNRQAEQNHEMARQNQAVTETTQQLIKSETDVQHDVVVEGIHDVEFLKRISRILSQADVSLPDLGRLETTGVIALVVNNGAAIAFPTGFAENGPAEFHLLDRETGPTAVQREAAIRAINARSNCRAALTSKRAIENYLHPDAIRAAGGVEIAFGDFDDVAETAAKATFNQNERGCWESVSRRARRRLRDKAKKWLNRDAVDRMTPERLAERDPDGEVFGWLRAIAELTTAPVDASV
jgi:hypothetical protein